MTTLTFLLPATGVLLAGGRSSRLGEPKALLDFAGRPLGLHLVSRLAQVTDQQLIVANDPTPYADWGIPLTADPVEFAGMGPLAGVLAALLAAATPAIVIVACDLPFMSAALAGHLLKVLNQSGADVAIPEHHGLLEPLYAAYTKACVAPIRHQLLAGNRRVASILTELKVRYVPEQELREFGTPDRLFFNINLPADLAVARAMWLGGDPQAGPEEK